MTRGARGTLVLLALSAGVPSLTAAQDPAPALCRSAEGTLKDTLYPPAARDFPGADSVLDRGPATEYAKGRPWFDTYERIFFRNATYIPFGVERRFVAFPLGSSYDDRILLIGAHDGSVPLYTPAKFVDDKVPTVLYLLAERGCVFQPYQELSTVHVNFGPPKVVADPLPAYLAVLEHVRATDNSRTPRPIVLDEKRWRYPGENRSTAPSHPDLVRDALVRIGALAGSCPRVEAPHDCAIAGPALLLQLGDVSEPPESLYVKIPPGDFGTFLIQRAQTDAMPDSARVLADLELDLWLSDLCPRTVSADDCSGSTRRYWYLLRRDPAGRPVVLGRLLLFELHFPR